MKKIIKALAIVGLAFASVLGLASCNEKSNTTNEVEKIKIGVYNQASWDGVGQSDNAEAYFNYLAANVKNSKGQALFEFVKSNTTDLSNEVSSFIAQKVDAVIILNTKTTTAVEATCKKAKVYHFNMSNEVTKSDVGSSPSQYCLGGVNNYFGNYDTFAAQWLDTVLADMQATGKTTAKVSTVEFPANINPALVQVVNSMKKLMGTGKYANISLGKQYISAGVPLANYIPGMVTELKQDLANPDKDAYGTNYIFGFANGAKTLTSYFAKGDFPGVKLCAIGYSDTNYSSYDTFLLNQAECGLEGLAAGIARIYQAVAGITCTDLDQFKNADGIVNIKTSWHIFNKTQYDAFVTYMYGGQRGSAKSNYTTNTPAIEASELEAAMKGTTLAALEALTCRTIDQVVAAKTNNQ